MYCGQLLITIHKFFLKHHPELKSSQQALLTALGAGIMNLLTNGQGNKC